MGLRSKFNLALLIAFAIGFGATWVLLPPLFVANAREQVLQDARIMMSAADGISRFTDEQIVPMAAAQNTTHFVRASVPWFVAQTTFRTVQASFPDFIYRVPALNPTNPNDRPSDWERDFIGSFRNNPALTELVGERETPTGRSLSLARPITVGSPDCLACHSTPAAAPAALLGDYGNANGFGWKLHETVGAQIVSVPMSVPLEAAHRIFLISEAVLAALFVVIAIVLNVLLHYMVIKPVMTVSRIANAVSLGETDVEDYERKGTDEIAVLAASFTRMRRSLDSAMNLLDH